MIKYRLHWPLTFYKGWSEFSSFLYILWISALVLQLFFVRSSCMFWISCLSLSHWISGFWIVFWITACALVQFCLLVGLIFWFGLWVFHCPSWSKWIDISLVCGLHLGPIICHQSFLAKPDCTSWNPLPGNIPKSPHHIFALSAVVGLSSQF